MVTSNGGGDASILDIGLGAGTDPSCSLVGVPPATATLGTGQSRTITAEFSPPPGSATATQPSGSLQIVSGYPTPSDHTYTVNASATVGVPDPELSPSQISFGAVTCAGALLDQTLTAATSTRVPARASWRRQAPTQLPVTPACAAGIGCNLVQAMFTALHPGTAVLSASRTSCGEALLCPPDERRFAATVAGQ